MSNDDEPNEGSAGSSPGESRRGERRRRVALRAAERSAARDAEERITQRLAHQWAQMREERRAVPTPIVAGPSNFNRAQVPWGLDLAASWSWRLIVIGAGAYALYRMVGFFSVVTLPVAIALLIAALASPFVALLRRVGLPRSLAAILVVLGGLAVVTALLTFAGQQVAAGAQDLADSTVEGLGTIRTWLKTGPLNASDSQINDYIQQAQGLIRDQSRESQVVTQVTEVGAALGHLVAGFFIVLFASYFFLADGDRIWAWIVRIAPRAGRERVDSSGRVAWISLTQFVRATVIVALVDAVGIMIVAAVLQVPFVLAIGVLVFLGAFVPIVGATVAGGVAVLVALVDQGPVTALLMLVGVIVVQQIESHVLQPFLMGRFVSVHPLGVILAIAAGIVVGGVAGALVAVPLAAAVNAVVQHLASHTDPGSDPEEELAEDYGLEDATTRVPSDADDARTDAEGRR